MDRDFGDEEPNRAKKSAASIVPGHNHREGSNLLVRVQPKMRKDKEHQKNEIGKQLNLFAINQTPNESPADGIGKGNSKGDELSSRLKEQQTQTTNILERSVDYENQNRAYNP